MNKHTRLQCMRGLESSPPSVTSAASYKHRISLWPSELIIQICTRPLKSVTHASGLGPCHFLHQTDHMYTLPRERRMPTDVNQNSSQGFCPGVLDQGYQRALADCGRCSVIWSMELSYVDSTDKAFSDQSGKQTIKASPDSSLCYPERGLHDVEVGLLTSPV